MSSKPPPRRFIPKEDLPEVSAWTMGALGASHGRPSAARASQANVQTPAQQADAARNAAYEQGYREGLKALDDYRQSQAHQFVQRLDSIAAQFAAQLHALESDMAGDVVQLALIIARQVVRSELTVHPERIAPVVMEALRALVESKGTATIYLSPADLPLVLDHLGDELAVQGYSILTDNNLTPGGCRIDAGLSSVDATVESRWEHAIATIGRADGWIDRGTK